MIHKAIEEYRNFLLSRGVKPENRIQVLGEERAQVMMNSLGLKALKNAEDAGHLEIRRVDEAIGFSKFLGLQLLKVLTQGK